MPTPTLLSKLDPRGFEQYLAAATVVGAVGPGVADQVRERFRDNTLTPTSILLVLVNAREQSWQPLRNEVWRWTQADPWLAVSVLKASASPSMSDQLSHLVMHTGTYGEGTGQVRIAWASVMTRDGPVGSAPHVSTSQDDPLGPAVLDLLGRLGGLPVEIADVHVLPALAALEQPPTSEGNERLTSASLALVLVFAARGGFVSPVAGQHLISLLSMRKNVAEVVRLAIEADGAWGLRLDPIGKYGIGGRGFRGVLRLPHQEIEFTSPQSGRDAIQAAYLELIKEIINFGAIDSLTPDAFGSARQGEVTIVSAAIVMAVVMAGWAVPRDVATITMAWFVEDPRRAELAIQRQAVAWEVPPVPASLSTVPLFGPKQPGYADLLVAAMAVLSDGRMVSPSPSLSSAESAPEHDAALHLASALLGVSAPTAGKVSPRLRAIELLGHSRSDGGPSPILTAADLADLIMFVALGGEMPPETTAGAALLSLTSPTTVVNAMGMLLTDPRRLVRVEMVPANDGTNGRVAALVVGHPGFRSIHRAQSPRFSVGASQTTPIWALRGLYIPALRLEASIARLHQQLIDFAATHPLDEQIVTAIVSLALDGVPLPPPIEDRCAQWIAADPVRPAAIIERTEIVVASTKCHRKQVRGQTMAWASATTSRGEPVAGAVITRTHPAVARAAASKSLLDNLLHQPPVRGQGPPPLLAAVQDAVTHDRNLAQTISRFDNEDLADVIAYAALGGPVPSPVARALVGLVERREIAPERALYLVDPRERWTVEGTESPNMGPGPKTAEATFQVDDLKFTSGPVHGLRLYPTKQAALTILVARILRTEAPDYSERLIPAGYRSSAPSDTLLQVWEARIDGKQLAKVIFGSVPSTEDRRAADHQAEQIFAVMQALMPREARLALKAAPGYNRDWTEIEITVNEEPPRYPLAPPLYAATATATVFGEKLTSPEYTAYREKDAADLAAAYILKWGWRSQQQLGSPRRNTLPPERDTLQ